MIVQKEQENIIKSILNVRCREGATIADIERKSKLGALIELEFICCVKYFEFILITEDYEELVGEPQLDIYNYLNSMDCVYCIKSPSGEIKWYVNSENSIHITKLIREQKSNIQKQKPQKMLNDSINGNDCFFKDNIIYRHMR